MNGYSSLPSRPAGPTVHSHIAPVLGLLLRLINTVFAALALILLAYALYLDWQYKRSSGGDVPASSPDPTPSTSPDPDMGPDVDALPSRARLQQLFPLIVDFTDVMKDTAVASFPWFIYAMGATGTFVFCTALVGISGVRRGSSWRLAMYIAMISILILGQAAALLLFFTSNQWKERIPGDPSGCWEAAQRFMEKYSSLVKVACLVVMAAELVALAAASWLHSLQQAAYEAWLDDREEAEARAREVLQQTVERQFAGGSGSLWTQHMRQKYGVDDSQVQCDAAAVRHVAALTGDAPV